MELEIFLVDLADKLKTSSWFTAITYLSDIFGHGNSLSKKLYGMNINVILAREKISVFGSSFGAGVRKWNER